MNRIPHVLFIRSNLIPHQSFQYFQRCLKLFPQRFRIHSHVVILVLPAAPLHPFPLKPFPVPQESWHTTRRVDPNMPRQRVLIAQKLHLPSILTPRLVRLVRCLVRCNFVRHPMRHQYRRVWRVLLLRPHRHLLQRLLNHRLIQIPFSVRANPLVKKVLESEM